MQSKQRTAQRSPITHGSRFTQRLHTIMRREKKIVDFVDSKVEDQAPTTIEKSDQELRIWSFLVDFESSWEAENC